MEQLGPRVMGGRLERGQSANPDGGTRKWEVKVSAAMWTPSFIFNMKTGTSQLRPAIAWRLATSYHQAEDWVCGAECVALPSPFSFYRPAVDIYFPLVISARSHHWLVSANFLLYNVSASMLIICQSVYFIWYRGVREEGVKIGFTNSVSMSDLKSEKEMPVQLNII